MTDLFVAHDVVLVAPKEMYRRERLAGQFVAPDPLSPGATVACARASRSDRARGR